MASAFCGWCITNRVRPEFLADRAAGCPRCAEHRAYKEAKSKPEDCQKNPYHICEDGNAKSCSCECHRVDGLVDRKPKPKIVLKKRKPNVQARNNLQS